MDAVRLTDDQMRTFIRDGYVIVRPNLPRDYHDEMFAKVDHLFEAEGNPGNNLLPRIPELQLLYDDPVTRGALASIMGTTTTSNRIDSSTSTSPTARARRCTRTRSRAGGITPAGS